MATGHDPLLDALDEARLAPLVAHALGRERVALGAWRWAPLATDLYHAKRTLARCSGTAHAGGDPLPWSLVLKILRPPPGAGDDGWDREARAYHSGLLVDLPGGLAAPRCLAVDTGADRSAWLWLDDIADRFGGRWPLAQYGRAARHLGQFNGAYLAGRPLPTDPWLVRQWTTRHSEPVKIPAALAELATLMDDPRARQAFPAPQLAAMPRLLHDEPRVVDLLARLPQTLCHHDAARANLLARRAGRVLETVALDWESPGPGTVGADIASLVCGTIRRGDYPARRAAALDRVVFLGYLRGLRDAGWAGDPDLVRLGYAAAVALRWFLLPDTLRVLTSGARAFRGRARESTARAAQELVLLSRFVLERAAEARGLARRRGFLP